MNHNLTLGIVAIVAATALSGVAFVIPQQALAGGHNHNHNQGNSIEVSQNTKQLNACSNSTCVNDASNSADIHR